MPTFAGGMESISKTQIPQGQSMKKISMLLLLFSVQVYAQQVHYDAYQTVQLSNEKRGYSYLSIFDSPGSLPRIVSTLDKVDFVRLEGGSLFHDPYDFDDGIESTGALAADMNQDGLVDLVVGSYWSNRVSIYMGVAEGQFADPVVYPLRGHCAGLTVGFINDDPYPDVVGIRNGSGQPIAIHVWINDGQGRLNETFFHDAGDHTNNEVYLTDLNNDGKNDILIRSMNGFVVSYVQRDVDDFDFHYIPIMPLIPGTPFTIPGGNAISNADYDQDGFDDLVVSYQDSLIIRKGIGNGDFEQKPFFKREGAPLGNLVAANLNGQDDFLLATRIDNLNLSNADSLFVLQYDHTLNELERVQEIELPKKLGYLREQVKVTDLDANGILDLVILAENNELLVYPGDGDPVTSLPDDPEIQFQVYPNPTAGRIFIDTRSFKGSALKIEILNLAGQVKVSQHIERVTEDLLTLDLNGPERLQLIRLISNGATYLKRIILSEGTD